MYFDMKAHFSDHDGVAELHLHKQFLFGTKMLLKCMKGEHNVKLK